MPDDFAQGALDFFLPRRCVLPAVESDEAHDVVDVANDALDHDGRVLGLDAVEKLRESGFTFVLLFFRNDFLFGARGFAGELEELAQELDAVDEPLFVLLAQSFEFFTDFLIFFLNYSTRLIPDGIAS